jgi:hypothetical protein
MEERLIYKGKTYMMCSTPLETYFEEEHPRPREFDATSTACWRGYIGTWKIEGGRLCLLKLIRERWEIDEETGESRDWEEEIPLSLLFGEEKPPILAVWYSGVLRLPQGEQLRYVHMGFGSIYEKDLYITVKKGRVVREQVVDNRGKGATRSTADLQWVAIADKPVQDDGNWYDAREIDTDAFWRTVKEGEQFITRGIFFAERFEDQPGGQARLWIPATPTTRSLELVLRSLPEEHECGSGQHVEIDVHWAKSEDGPRFLVKSIRLLKPGESIHHPDFVPPEDSEQPDAGAGGESDDGEDGRREDGVE